VLVLEKNPQVGGNSAKASSGINAVNPAGGDSPATYSDDTLQSGGGLSDSRLVERLVVRASAARASAFGVGCVPGGRTEGCCRVLYSLRAKGLLGPGTASPRTAW
jgi:aspartate oxidase